MSKSGLDKSALNIETWHAPKVSEDFNPPKIASHAEKTSVEEEARQRGYQDGLVQGLQQAQIEQQQWLTRLEQLLNTIASPLSGLDEEVEHQLVHLCIVIAKQLVRRELKADPKQILGVVREALKILPVASSDVQIHLHPEDAELIRETLTKPGQEFAWKVIEDPMLTRGGCHVTSHASRIDARVESRIGKIFAELLSGDRESDY
ncbi:MAG: flagellar assembly protein FliH [Pseudomonadota bacterium]